MQKQPQQISNIKYQVIVPLTIVYRSKLTGTAVETFYRTLDLPIMGMHLEDFVV
jgi:hypothetical protein